MTVQELVEASGIEKEENFSTFDYALPMNSDGSYPYDGKAISVYWKKRLFPDFVPYKELAERALKNPENSKISGELKELIKNL